MRLLTLTNRYYLLLLVLVLLIWSGVLYFVLQWEVYDNVDEVLSYRKRTLIENITQRGVIPSNDIYHDFVIFPVAQIPKNRKDSFQDTLLQKKRGYDEYRKITSYFDLNGQPYRMSMILPHLEQDELIDTLAYTLPVLLVMLLIGFFLVANRLNKKLWQPFYEVLHQFEKFRIDKGTEIHFQPTHIKEFGELQAGVADLTNKSMRSYLQQKQFTENASHEIQTPLAVIQSKLELFFQQPLTEQQAGILEDLFLATRRLSKINETLLLLTRIENNQFTEKTEVNVRALVEEIIPFFIEQATKYEIETTVNIPATENIHANATVLTILITNLLKNAFIHNLKNGRVEIKVENQKLTVTNTGEALIVPTAKIFDRFFSQSPGKGGLGLGLAIAKSICEVNNWKVNYHQSENIHEISVEY
jgi:signal transduction histidine kinase